MITEYKQMKVYQRILGTVLLELSHHNRIPGWVSCITEIHFLTNFRGKNFKNKQGANQFCFW